MRLKKFFLSIPQNLIFNNLFAVKLLAQLIYKQVL